MATQGSLTLLIRPFARSHIHRTPLLTSTTFNKLASHVVQGITSADGQNVTLQIALKCENFQKVGAFKVCLLVL